MSVGERRAVALWGGVSAGERGAVALSGVVSAGERGAVALSAVLLCLLRTFRDAVCCTDDTAS